MQSENDHAEISSRTALLGLCLFAFADYAPEALAATTEAQVPAKRAVKGAGLVSATDGRAD